MKTFTSAVFFLTFCWAVTSQASEKTTISIEIKEEAKFEVFYHRAVSNATGAVIAGLIGAGIQSSVESGKDDKKAAQLEPLIEKDTWKSYFLDTLNNKLASKNYEAQWVENKEAALGDLLLTIYPENYGFRVVESTTMLMSAYVDFKAKLTVPGAKKSNKDKKRFYVTSKEKRAFENFVADQDAVNSDLQAALTKAARRVANKIIYNKEV